MIVSVQFDLDSVVSCTLERESIIEMVLPAVENYLDGSE